MWLSQWTIVNSHVSFQQSCKCFGSKSDCCAAAFSSLARSLACRVLQPQPGADPESEEGDEQRHAGAGDWHRRHFLEEEARYGKWNCLSSAISLAPGQTMTMSLTHAREHPPLL